MTAITVCQPYASLLIEPEFLRADPKGIENRPNHWKHRGPIIIHAGKSRSWLSSWNVEYGGSLPHPMPFGAALGICDLVDCITIEDIRSAGSKWNYLANSIHANGPWCLIMLNPRPFPTPIPYKGSRGPWTFPNDLIPEALR